MSANTCLPDLWIPADRALKRLQIFIILFILVYLLATHLPHFRGKEWSICLIDSGKLTCQWILHLCTIPVLLYNLIVSLFISNKYSKDRAFQASLLVTIYIAFNTVFLVFQAGMALYSIKSSAESWEVITSTGLTVVMVIGVVIAILANLRLSDAIYEN